MQALFYAVPIIYPLALVSDRWPEVAKIMLLNPVAQAIQDVRYVVITPETQTLGTITSRKWVVLPILIVIVTFIGAMLYFKKRAPYFAEEV